MIIRENPEINSIVPQYSIIGRVLILRHWDESTVQVYESTGEIFHYSVGNQKNMWISAKGDPNEYPEVHLDFDTLKVLTSQPHLPEGSPRRSRHDVI